MSQLTSADLVKSAFEAYRYDCKKMEEREGSGTPFSGNPPGTCVFFKESTCDGDAIKDQRNLCYCGNQNDQKIIIFSLNLKDRDNSFIIFFV